MKDIVGIYGSETSIDWRRKIPFTSPYSDVFEYRREIPPLPNLAPQNYSKDIYFLMGSLHPGTRNALVSIVKVFIFTKNMNGNE